MNGGDTLKRDNASLVIWMLILNIGYLFVYPFNNILLTYIFRLPALMLIAFIIVKNYTYSFPKYVVPLLILGVLCLLNIIRCPDSLTFDLILSIASIYSLLLLVIVSPKISIGIRLRRHIFILSIITAMVLTLHAFAPYGHLARSHEGVIFSTPYLTFGFGNSNFAGINAFLVFSCIWISSSYNSFRSKLFTLLVSGWVLYMIFETNCRSAFAAALLVPIASIILRRFHLKNILLYIGCLIPFIFVPFYINFANDTDANVEVMGKSVVSGRQIVYQAYLDRMSDDIDYVVGTFAHKPFNNAHNAPLSIFVSLGAIGCFAFFYILINRLKLDNTLACSFTAKAAIYAIIAIYIESCGEASLFLGGFPCVILFFIIYVFASYNGKSW